MPDVTNIMDQYLNTGMSILDPKQSAVARAAAEKKAELDPQGYRDGAARDVGYSSPSLSPTDPVDPIALIARAAGDSRYMEDATRPRTTGQAIGDSFNSAMQGVFLSPVEIANLPISAISPDAGAAVSDFIQTGRENAQSLQSDALNARRRAYAGRNEVTSGVNKQKYDEEVGQDGAFVAGLRRLGRDAVDAITNTDGVMATDLIANAVGSLVTAGPEAKAIGLLGKESLRAGMKVGAVTRGGARTALELGSKAQMPLTIGLQEAAGANQQTASEILDMDFGTLEANSPEYRQAVSEGYSPEEARNLIARNAGLEAAAIQFPLAAATGTIVGKFEKSPFKPNSIRGAVGNVAKEGVEEGFQSGTGQLAQNIGTKDQANENQDLLEGVGEQASLGALAGMGSAGITSAPGAALKTTVDAAKGTVNLAVRGAKAVGAKVEGSYNSLMEANEKASPVSADNVRPIVDAAVAAAPEIQATVTEAVNETSADDAQKTRAGEYLNTLVSATQISPEELEDPDHSEGIQSALSGSANRFEAMQRLVDVVNNSEDGSPEQLSAALALKKTMEPVTNALQQEDAGAIDDLADDHPAKQLVDLFEKAVSSIRQSAEVSKVLDRVDDIAKAASTSGALAPVSEDQIDTPEGKQSVRNTIAVAETSPLSSNPEANNQILRHAEAGKVNITPAQRAALKSSTALIVAEKARLAEIERLGLSTNTDIVSQDVTSRDSGQEAKTPSLAGHVKRIVAASKAGDKKAAALYLRDLKLFAMSMQNKVGALNTHLQTGNGQKTNAVSYKTLTPGRKWVDSNSPLWVNPRAAKTVATAQAIANDAAIAAKVANDMVAIFPDLGVKPVKAVELDPSLMTGTADEVAAAHTKGRTKTEAKLAEQKPEQPAEAISTPEPEDKGQPEGGDTSVDAKVDAEATTQTQEKKAEADPQLELSLEQSPTVEEKPEAGTATKDAPAQAEADAGTAETSKTAPKPGKPVKDLLVYHGTQAEFDKFSSTASGQFGPGVYTTASETEAKNYSRSRNPGDKPSVLQTHITLNNPLEITAQNTDGPPRHWFDQFRVAGPKDRTNAASAAYWANQGYDGVIAHQPLILGVNPDGSLDLGPMVTHYIAFDPKAVRIVARDGKSVAAEDAKPEPKKTIAELFPKLASWSWLRKIFRVPAEPKTRIIGTGSPLAVIRGALASADALRSFLGSSLKHDFSDETARVYGEWLGNADKIQEILAKRLAESKEKARFLKGETQLPSYRNGKVLNLTDEVDGDLVYNQELLEAATLAALQWMLVADHHQSKWDEEETAGFLDISEDVFQDVVLDKNGVAHSLIEQLNTGLTLVEAKRSLASKIRTYWGLSNQPNAELGLTEGIAEAMAAEMLEALVEAKAIQQTTWEVGQEAGLSGKEKRTVHIFQPITQRSAEAENTGTLQDPKHPLYAFPEAIDQAVLTEPEPVNYIGEAPAKVAETQLRNPRVKHTDQQKQAIEFEQKQPHYANMVMVNLFQALDNNNILRLFGAGDLKNRPLNAMDKKSKEGLNLTFSSAYGSLNKLMAEVLSMTKAAGVDPDQMAVYYDYAFTRVNRMQMLGPNNPQASKLMREAFLPTRATIDLSDVHSETFDLYVLALAQGLGIKIHDQSQEATREDLRKLLGSPQMKAAVEVLQSWLKDQSKPLTAEQVETIAVGLGSENTPVALHVLTDYARYLAADEAGRKAFTTSVYIEADGVTNGPANAMQLLSPGAFTPEWLRASRKIGLFPGATNRSMNEHREFGDPDDFYTDTSNSASRFMADLAKQFSRLKPEMGNQLGALSRLMDRFLKDARLVNGKLVLKRGVAKNPLTVTLYGAGAKGIANKVAGELLDSIYEQLSEAMKIANEEKISFEEALFPGYDKAEAQQKYRAFLKDINALTTRVVMNGQYGFYIVDGKPTLSRDFNPETFAITGNDLDNLRQNIETMFVTGLREAISNTVGLALMKSADELRQAVQIQSIFRQYDFEQRVKKKLTKKAKDPEWRKENFLSKEELNEIHQKQEKLFPLIHTGTQSFYVGKKQTVNLGQEAESEDGTKNRKRSSFHFGSSLGDQLRTPAYVDAPSDAGVGGIPAIVIGTGDGQEMQTLSTMEGAPERTLKVFDGVHFPLDGIREGSQKANQAVFETWMRNPLQAVSDSYQEFLKHLKVKNLSDAQVKALKRALNLPNDMEVSDELLEQLIRSLGDKVQKSAIEIEARHRALARVNLSVDQLAGAASPYNHEGDVSLVDMDDAQIIKTLNDLYHEEYAKLTAKPEVSENIAPEIEKFGRKLKNGARVISYTGLKKLYQALSIPAEQKSILADVIRTLTAKEYQVVYGTQEEVRAYADERGLDLQYDPTDTKITNGFIIPSHKTIYLYNATSETLVHELIHAATIAKLRDYYSDNSLGTNAVEQVRAIQRLEKLMEQFMELPLHTEDAETQEAYFNATDEIEYHLARGDKAAALNEFMAWGLTNSKLQALQKKTDASPLVQLARKVVDMIKRLVAGNRSMSRPGNDMFSNLRFNTAVLMQAQRSENIDPRKAFDSTILFHNQSYGNSERLANLNQAINRQVVRHLENQLPSDRVISDKLKNRWVDTKLRGMLAQTDIALGVIDQGFDMNMQEKTTFHLLTSILRTAVQLDPNALNRVQDLYSHVTKNIHPDNFLADEHANDPWEQQKAERKVDLIVGSLGMDLDEHGRSSLLPVFLSLAIVNDEFRSVLAKMEVPKTERKEGKTLDAQFDNFLGRALDELTAKVSGEGRNAPNIQAAIDALTQRVIDTAEDRQSYMDQIASPVGNAIDAANQWVKDAMQRLAEATKAKSDKVKASTNSKIVKLGAELANGLAGMLDANTMGNVAEGYIAGLNRGEYWTWFRELVGDVIGRTNSNADIFDMIKVVRDVIQRRRQQFRENLPKFLATKFSRKLTEEEWTVLFHTLGKTDIAALHGYMSNKHMLTMLGDPTKVTSHINKLQATLRKLEPKHHARIMAKADQLAEHIVNGKYGVNLLSNARAVANLFGEGVKKDPASDALIDVVDRLTTLLALDKLPQQSRETLSSLVQDEEDGISFVLDYLAGQRVDELSKVNRSGAEVNHYKGAMPSQPKGGGTLIVANDADHAALLAKSFVRVGDYKGSNLDKDRASKGYYYAPVSGRSVYNQGIIQNVRPTAYGVDLVTGFSHAPTAGRIVDPAKVQQIFQNMHKERAAENLRPLYDLNGKIVAFERTIDPAMAARTKTETNLSKVIGNWRGRQLEELEAQHVNEVLIDKLHAMWEKDLAADPSSKDQYVNLRDPRVLKKDPVLADVVKLLSGDTHTYVDQVFGTEHFYVRRDMLNDALGYHAASIGDAWTGTSRLPQEVLQGAQKLAMGVFGNNAYKYMVKSEQFIQNAVSDARVMIVVKSVVVPVTNLIANVYQLWGRGVPMSTIVRMMPRKAAEVSSYLKTRLRLDEIEAELRATKPNSAEARRLQAEQQSIQDDHRRMSIWPLIEAGEFSSISDGLLTHDDLDLTEGRLSEWIEKKVDKLPESVRTLGRYAWLSKDTALFQALQRSVEYGDFLAKAVLYDHLTGKEKLSSKDAIGRISEEYVNYDRLPGRSRGYIESMGMWWFWSFKIRSTKIALSMLRNNPVHALLAMALPAPEVFGSVGNPVEDNIVTMGANGRLGWSIGPGMGLRSWLLNPWVNLVS